MELFEWIWERIRTFFGKPLRRADILRESLKEYKRSIESGFYTGLCFTICKALNRHGVKMPSKFLGELVKYYIPAFGEDYDNLFGEYWWDKYDTKSRIAYLEKLIELYKNDKTNILCHITSTT